MLPKMVTAKEIAEQLKMTPEAIYNLGRQGILPGMVRSGRSVRFIEEDVAAWIKAGGAAHPGGWRREAVQ